MRIIVNGQTGEQTTDNDFVGGNYNDPAQISANKQTQKRLAYEAESDPLFFKWQAGEGTEQAWLDKRAEIDVRFE